MDGACFYSDCFDCDIFRITIERWLLCCITFPIIIDGFGHDPQRQKKGTTITQSWFIWNYLNLLTVTLPNKHVIDIYSNDSF